MIDDDQPWHELACLGLPYSQTSQSGGVKQQKGGLYQ